MTAGLEGKVAVVSGGGSGLGEAIARRFAASGCAVVVAGRRRQPLEAVAAAVGGLAVATDVRDEAQVQALFAACEAAYGRLDVLVNNAGTPGPTAPAVEMAAAAWDEDDATALLLGWPTREAGAGRTLDPDEGALIQPEGTAAVVEAEDTLRRPP